MGEGGSVFGEHTQVTVAGPEKKKSEEKMSRQLAHEVAASIAYALPEDEMKWKTIQAIIGYMEENRDGIKDRPATREVYGPFRDKFLAQLQSRLQGFHVTMDDIYGCEDIFRHGKEIFPYAPLAEAALFSIFYPKEVYGERKLLVGK